jgi:hypothetical protein
VLRQTQESQVLILENRDIRSMVESHMRLGNRVT